MTREEKIREAEVAFDIACPPSDAENELLRAIKVARDRPCILCGEAVGAVGVFIPNEDFARRLGQPKGKTRMITYGLCEPCLDLPDKVRDDKIEALMLKSFQVI